MAVERFGRYTKTLQPGLSLVVHLWIALVARSI